MIIAAIIGIAAITATGEGITLAQGHQPAAVIILPAKPFPIAEHAAAELAYHIERASGAKLEIRREPLESKPDIPAVYLGATQAARGAGIDPASLASEVTVLRTIKRDLYIVGNDGPGDALSVDNTHSGTLWGVYEILERYLGVRWLWPGVLGEHIPLTADIVIPPLDETFKPPFNQRRLRPGLGPRGFIEANAPLAFSPEHRERYAKDQNLFLRRHRMGQSQDSFYAQRSFGSGHSFQGWWERYGQEHPEWFQLLPGGRRGPADPNRPNNVSMCVSNPELQAEIVRRWQEERAKHPGEPFNIGVGENDVSAMCECERCKAWDGPPPSLEGIPPGLERSYTPMQASNRYARFAEAVRQRAAAIDPNVRVQYYAYLNYFWAPDPTIKLHPNIVIGFVPWFRGAGWFPRTDAEQEWIKQQWIGWRQTGASIYYRPNWFLDGYTMPLVYMRQFADAFQFYARNGMTGTDFDSLQGQWAAQGPNLYLLARIHVRPQANAGDLLGEYYAAFGPAANSVKEYFTYWEDYAVKNSPRAVESIRSRRGGNFRRYAHYALVADELYPPEVFPPAQTILARALEKAAESDDPLYKERVQFLEMGLRHAMQCVQTAKTVNNPDTTLAEKKAAITDLISLRRTLQHTNIANMDRAAIIETDSWKEIDGLFEP